MKDWPLGTPKLCHTVLSSITECSLSIVDKTNVCTCTNELSYGGGMGAT